MIPYVILFLPSIVCLFWAVLHTATSYRTSTYRLMMALLLDAMVFFFLDAFYNFPSVSTTTMLVVGMLGQFVAPCLVPLIAIYIERLNKGSVYHPLQIVWVVIPAVLFTASVALFMVSDPENIKTIIDGFYREGWLFIRPFRGKPEYFYFVSTELLSRAVLGLETILLVFILVKIMVKEKYKAKDIFDFWWRGGRIQLTELQIKNIAIITLLLSTKIWVFRGDVRVNLWLLTTITILLSIYIFKFSYLALFGTKKTLLLKDVRNSFRYNYNEDIKAIIEGEMFDEFLLEIDEETLESIHKKIAHKLNIDYTKPIANKENPATTDENSMLESIAADSYEEGSLMARFQHLMIDQQAYLQPRLTLDDVAEQLSSNKTYVSKLVNNNYNLGFPELINTLRINYAEQYIINHREARQDEIATACGFLSASSFNTIFKKVKGITPKVWIASIDKRR